MKINRTFHPSFVIQGLPLLLLAFAALAIGACSPSEPASGTKDAGLRDVTSGTGGLAIGSGGTPATGGMGSGGNAAATGGVGVGTGAAGGAAATGGTGTGGALAVSGGAPGTGGGVGGVGGAGGTAASGGGTGSGGRGGGTAGAGSGGSATGTGGVGGGGGAGTTPSRASVLAVLTRANDFFMTKWPDPGANIDPTHPSHIWTRAVYYEGLMALYGVDPQPRYYDYAVRWGTSHSWGVNGGTSTLSADNQCVGQTYIDLYNIDRQAVRIRDIEATMSRTLTLTAMTDWSWIDAIQMAMPVYAKLGVLRGNNAYFNKMYGLYSYTKNNFGTAGLYNKTEHLWWRDADFDPPYREPNGQDCYWSRGNGWVYAGLARILDIIPANEAHRAEYLADFVAMSEALRAVQRPDGFWNVSLHDPTNFGGKETTGSALFAYGMAMGVRKGWLSDAVYRPVAAKTWNAMVSDSVHPNGFLGWVQGTGKQPSDSQPVTYDRVPNYDDFGVGCFLLAGSEIARLATP